MELGHLSMNSQKGKNRTSVLFTLIEPLKSKLMTHPCSGSYLLMKFLKDRGMVGLFKVLYLTSTGINSFPRSIMKLTSALSFVLQKWIFAGVNMVY